MTSTTRNALVAVGAIAVVGILAWYFGIYDTAQGKCNRGDIGACLVLSAQQAQQSAIAAASQSVAAAIASREAAQASALASASASASTSASASALAVQEHATCQRVGGSWGSSILGSGCQVDYRGSDGAAYHYTLSFDSNGNVAPGSGQPQNAAQCSTYYGSGLTGYWHSDSDVCSL